MSDSAVGTAGSEQVGSPREASLTPRELVETRRAITNQMMAELDIDHLLLGTPDNIRYISDYRSLIIAEGSDWMMAVAEREGPVDIYGAHVRDYTASPIPAMPWLRSIRPLPAWSPAMSEPEKTVEIVATALRGAKRIGYDAVHPELLAALRARLSEHEFVYVGHELFRRRQVKLAAELTMMREACRSNTAAIEAAWAIAAEGVTDYELLAASLAEQQRQGAEVMTHYTCNVRADPGIWFPTGKPIRAGHTIFIDQVYYGPGGYASDLARTKFIGDPPARVVQAYDDFLTVTRDVQAAARPGAPIAMLDDLLNTGLQKFGLAPSPYGLGHGIGLRVCEPPSLGPGHLLDAGHTLVAGQTIAMEPETALIHDGREYAMKIEDVFLVADDGLQPVGELPTADEFVISV